MNPLLTIDFDASSVRAARKGVREAFADTPVADDAELIASELATNAALWSASGDEGGRIRVHVYREPGALTGRLEVIDDGAPLAIPGPRTPEGGDGLEEYGKGLKIVHELASAWGHTVRGGRVAYWAELTWKPESAVQP